MKQNLSRRSFLGTSAGFAAAGFSAMANPIGAAAQSVGVKPGDLPDLTIKEVKVYVTDISNIHKLNSPETGELLSIVTNSGIEGNYTIGDRNATPGQVGAGREEHHGHPADVDLDQRHEGAGRIRRWRGQTACWSGPARRSWCGWRRRCTRGEAWQWPGRRERSSGIRRGIVESGFTLCV